MMKTKPNPEIPSVDRVQGGRMAVITSTSSKPRRPTRLLPLILALMLLLSACSQKLDITINQSESWRVKSQVQYDEELLDLFGDLAGGIIGEELGVPLPSMDISDAIGSLDYVFGLARQQFAARGIRFSWQRAHDKLTLDLRGQNLVQFNQLAPQFASVEKIEDGQYHLTMDILTLADLDPGLEDMDDYTAGLFTYTVILHAGKIIRSNADLVQGGTATWYNPTMIDVVFTPAGSLLPVCLWGTGGLVLVAIIVAVASRFRGQRCPTCGARAGKNTEVCPNCGSSLYSSSL